MPLIRHGEKPTPHNHETGVNTRGEAHANSLAVQLGGVEVSRLPNWPGEDDHSALLFGWAAGWEAVQVSQGLLDGND